MKARRVIAYIADIVLIGILSGILSIVFSLSTSTWSWSGLTIVQHPATWLGLGVSVLYFMTDVWYGGSPGKKLLGISVIAGSASNKGSVAFVRSFLKVISINLLFGIILFLLWDEHTSFHDKIAGTSVQTRVQQ